MRLSILTISHFVLQIEKKKLKEIAVVQRKLNRLMHPNRPEFTQAVMLQLALLEKLFTTRRIDLATYRGKIQAISRKRMSKDLKIFLRQTLKEL